MSLFSKLRVADVQKETRDAVVVTLDVPADKKEDFKFIQGQYLTFRKDFDGEELRRSYSICAGADEDCLTVGIKHVDGGAFSGWANEELKAGDEIDVMKPSGTFYVSCDEAAERNYLALAIGSGITPILSHIKTVLAREPKSKFTLVYGNRSTSSIMFKETLEDLKNRYLGRLNVVHILKSDAQDIDLFTGRIDREKCDQLFSRWIDIASMDYAFICGPQDMMETVSQALKDHGMRDDQIKFELFLSAQPGRAKKRASAKAAANSEDAVKATIILDGVSRTIEMPRDGVSLLEAAEDHSIEAPYSCKGGVCSTCRAKVMKGKMEMETNFALEDYEVEQGYVLTCQARPLTDEVVVDYDQH